MTTAPTRHENEHGHDSIDRQARQLHAAALAHTSASTLARLRQARRDTSAVPRRRSLLAPWLAGGAVAAAVVLAVVLQPGTINGPAPGMADAPRVASQPLAPAPAPIATATADPAEPLQEDPGFYVWLDSVDPTALAME